MAARILKGVTVVAMEQAVSAPLCTRHLADLGARVIKIERLGEGDYLRTVDSKMNGMCSHFVWTNRGKESVSLDVKQPEGLKILEELVAKADVFVQNLAPGASKRLGVDGATLGTKYPSLIACTISGYGSGGPYEQKKAYDLLVQAEAGLVDITGTPETASKVGIPIADIASGMYAYSGILGALYRRATHPDKLGSVFEVSMLDALGDWMGWVYNYSMYSGDVVKRSGASHAAIQPYGPFQVGSKGEMVMLAVQSNREWKSFCEIVLQQSHIATLADFATMQQRVINKSKLQALIESTFKLLTLDQVVDRLEKASIAYGQYRSVPEAINHPQWQAQSHWTTINSPVGPLKVIKPVIQFEASDGDSLGGIPDVGEHTRAVLEQFLGYSPEHVTDLQQRGIV